LELPRGRRLSRSVHFSHAQGGSRLIAVQQPGPLGADLVAPSTGLLLNSPTCRTCREGTCDHAMSLPSGKSVSGEPGAVQLIREVDVETGSRYSPALPSRHGACDRNDDCLCHLLQSQDNALSTEELPVARKAVLAEIAVAVGDMTPKRIQADQRHSGHTNGKRPQCAPLCLRSRLGPLCQ